MFHEVNPVLPCRDVTAAVEFYVTKLGFTARFKDAAQPKYAGVRRDGVELHLQWHEATEWERVERPSLRFYVDDVDALYDEFRGRDIIHDAVTLRDTPWSTREFAFCDPDGNELTFYEDLEAA